MASVNEVVSNSIQNHCKTLYFSCILIWRFWSVEISLHFNLAFFSVRTLQGKVTSDFSAYEQNCVLPSVLPYSTSTYRSIQNRKCLLAVLIFSSMKFSDGQSEFSPLFNFAILCYLRNSRKLDACEKLLFYSNKESCQTINFLNHVNAYN